MSTQQLSLAQTQTGEIVRIAGLETDGPMRRRLQDIGFTSGVRVLRLQSGPAGDPTAFYISGPEKKLPAHSKGLGFWRIGEEPGQDLSAAIMRFAPVPVGGDFSGVPVVGR